MQPFRIAVILIFVVVAAAVTIGLGAVWALTGQSEVPVAGLVVLALIAALVLRYLPAGK